jgi:predicted nucleotidyltransferase
MDHDITGKTPSNSNIDDMIIKLKKYLSLQNDIVLVFIFGSFVRREITFDSDVDIAISFIGTVDFYRINGLKEDISKMLGIDADIVVLNSASPVIKMQVLKKGNLLINKARKVYNAFFVNTVNEYDDLKRTRKEIEENILRGRIYA